MTAAIVERDGRYLVARRRPGGPCGLRWEFPGGKVEPGESDSEALSRELREELGVAAEVGPPEPVVHHAYPEFDVELRPYRVTIAGDPVALDHAELAWVARGDLLSLDLCAADVPIARALTD